MDEKLRKFNVFLSKDTFTCEIVNILCLYEYFGLYTVPQTFRDIIYISPTAHSFPTAHNSSNQTVFCFFRSSFFTAAFPQPTAHSNFSKATAQPNTPIEC
jgi:hypothetical protein